MVQQGGRQAVTTRAFIQARISHQKCGFLFFLHSSCRSNYESCHLSDQLMTILVKMGVWGDALSFYSSRNRNRTNFDERYPHSIQLRMVLDPHLQYIGSSENVTRSLLRASHAKLHRQSPKMRTWQAPQPLTSS